MSGTVEEEDGDGDPDGTEKVVGVAGYTHQPLEETDYIAWSVVMMGCRDEEESSGGCVWAAHVIS